MTDYFFRVATAAFLVGSTVGCDPGDHVKSKSWVEKQRPEALKCRAAIEKDGIGNGRDLEDVRRTLDDSTHRSWEDRQRFEIYLQECQNRTLFTGYRKREDPAELRAQALDAWDKVDRSNTDERRKKLRKAAKSVQTDTSGSTRIDAYHMKDGRLIMCTTKVADSGAFMKCDGEP